MKKKRADRGAPVRHWACLLVVASVFLSPPSRHGAQGEEVGETRTPPGPAVAAGKGFPEILTEPQRIFLAWSEKEFAPEVDRSRFAGFPETERKKLETKWLLDLEKPRADARLEAINCLGAIES
ncbi:MAG TPA: hypothetical protein VM492_00710, partial [Sumerlaeia bacterium]|nr:hypothetical protein [Sumerlaeia bacterium]